MSHAKRVKVSYFFGLLAVLLWVSPGQAVNYKLVPDLEEMKDRSHAPEFTLPDPTGKKIALKNFREKLILLNFWATWCAPCREEMPSMERLYRRFKDNGFVILGVNVKDRRNDALSFLKELNITFPIVLDPDGQVGLLYGAWGLPATYLIDPNSIAIARAWGPADWDGHGARQLIAELLKNNR